MGLFPIKDNEIAAMKLGDALYWAADDDGYLTNTRRLERVARVRGYNPHWVRHCFGQHWREVVGRTKRFRAQQREEEVVLAPINTTLLPSTLDQIIVQLPRTTARPYIDHACSAPYEGGGELLRKLSDTPVSKDYLALRAYTRIRRNKDADKDTPELDRN